MSTKDTYHHGNLRSALIDSGLRLLENKGLDRLSLRAVAADAGVSHAAPAHHFGNLCGLLTAIATVGFERFQQGMQTAKIAAGDEPVEVLRAIGHAYANFAAGNPEQFKLMFSGNGLDWTNTELTIAARAAYDQLSTAIVPIAANLGVAEPAGITDLEIMTWSFVHGYAHLLISGQLNPLCGPDGSPPHMPDFPALLTRKSIKT